MVDFLVYRIKKGKMTIDQIPDKYKEEVIERLKEEGWIINEEN